jgi:hypothetical protein
MPTGAKRVKKKKKKKEKLFSMLIPSILPHFVNLQSDTPWPGILITSFRVLGGGRSQGGKEGDNKN